MRAVLISLILFSTVAYAPPTPVPAPDPRACPLHAASTDYSLNPFPATYEVAWRRALTNPDSERRRILIAMIKAGGHEARVLRRLEISYDESTDQLTFPTFHRMLVLFDGVAGDGLAYGAPHLRPGLILRTGPNRGIPAGVGTSFDPEWRAVPIHQVSPDNIGWMIHNRFVPLSLERLLHDFFHVFSMAAYQDYAQVVYELRHHFYTVRGLHSEDKARRFAYFYEAFAAIPAAHRAAVNRMLGAPFVDGRIQDLTLAKLLQDERDVAIGTIEERAEALIRAHHPFVVYYGSAGRESGSPVSSLLYDNAEFLYESIPLIARRLRYALNDAEFFGRRLDVRTEYQRFRVALYYSVGVTPRDFQAAAQNYEPLTDERNLIYQLFVHSGMGTAIRGDGRDGMMVTNFSSPRPRPEN